MSCPAALNPDFTFWTIRWGDEWDVYPDRSEAEGRVLFIIDFNRNNGKLRAPFAVIEANASDGIARDVTWDFMPEDHDDEAEYAEANRHRAWERSMAPGVL